MTKTTTMDGGLRFVQSEPKKSTDDALLEPLYDLLGGVLAHAKDEFYDELEKRDAKIADLQARIAERESKQAANFVRLQADLVKQIKRLTARLSEQERKHAREIGELKAKAAPTSSEIIGYGTSKTEYRIVPYKSNGRPGASINLRPLFERYYQETQE
jgi:hypothetical protein